MILFHETIARRSTRSRGFTLVEIMIAMLLLSALGLGFTSYMRRNHASLQSSDVRDQVRLSSNLAQKMLSEDIQQAVFLNPSCDTNALSADATIECSDIIFRGGIIPLPDMTKEGLDSNSSFALPAKLEEDANALVKPNDAIRIVQYNFTGEFNCRLNDVPADNPSRLLERLWIDQMTENMGVAVPLASQECTQRIQVGKLYLLLENSGTTTYSNIFQVTGKSVENSSADELTPKGRIQIDIASSLNKFNQPGGLGISGFSSDAKVYPVKIVEWAVGESGGLYRRVIDPDESDMNAVGDWTLMQADVENMQFTYTTVLPTGEGVLHNRTMNFSGAAGDNGVEDIRGVSPRIIVKSPRTSSEGANFDNPLTAEIETDNYPREETSFFVWLRNTAN